MGLDIKLFRNQKTLKTIVKSEQTRKKDSKNTEEVIKLDSLWRESKRKLDETNSEINSNNSKIKQLWKSDQESAKSISSFNQTLLLQRKSLEEQEETFKKSLNLALNLIGNIIHEEVEEIIQNLPILKLGQTSRILQGEVLISKHRILSEFLFFGQQEGYLLLQTPSLVLQSLFLKVFPFKRCLTIPGKKPKTLVKSPLDAVLLSFYKENLKVSMKILAQGVYFSAKPRLKQSEKFCLISLCDLQSFEESSRVILKDFEKVLMIFAEGRKIIKKPRPSVRVSKSASYQIDFFLSLEEGLAKIGTFSIIGDYISRSGQITIKGKEFVQVICATFNHFFEYV